MWFFSKKQHETSASSGSQEPPFLDKAKEILSEAFRKRAPGVLPKAVEDMVNKIEQDSDDGRGEITTMQVFRAPVQAYVGELLEAVTKGKWKETVAKSDYDEMFHLAILINGKYRLEKNEVISLIEDGKIPHEANFMRVALPAKDGKASSLTVRSLLDNTREAMGPEDFTNYNAVTNNCQDFVLGVLQGNDLSTELLVSFVYQDAEALFSELPEYTSDVAVAATDIAAVSDRLLEEAKEKVKEGHGSYQRVKERIAELRAEYGDDIPEDVMKKEMEQLSVGPAETAAIIKVEKMGNKFQSSLAMLRSMRK